VTPTSELVPNSVVRVTYIRSRSVYRSMRAYLNLLLLSRPRSILVGTYSSSSLYVYACKPSYYPRNIVAMFAPRRMMSCKYFSRHAFHSFNICLTLCVLKPPCLTNHKRKGHFFLFLLSGREMRKSCYFEELFRFCLRRRQMSFP
jgi:hypothetical protein